MPQVLDQIGAAAVRLIAVQGYDGTTLAQIAAEVGYSKSALLYHFNSKEELLSQALEGPAGELERFFSTAPGCSRTELLARFVELVVANRYEVLIFIRFNRQVSELSSIQPVAQLLDDVVGLFVSPEDPLVQRVAVHLALGGIVETALRCLDVPDRELGEALLVAAGGALTSAASAVEAHGVQNRPQSQNGWPAPESP
jgi:AcrR family transcriptional regulator